MTGIVDWLLARGATNVLLEIGNEVDLAGVWAHSIIAAPRCHELIELAQKRSKGKLLVSTSLLTLDAPSPEILATPISCCRTAIAFTARTA